MKQPEQSYTAIETAHGFVFFTDTTEGQKNRQDFLQFMADHYFDPHFNLGPVNVYRAEGVLKDGSYVNPGEGLYPEYAYLQMDKTPEMELVYRNEMKPTWEDCKYSINSLVYWVTYVHNVVYSFYRSMIYCYINSTQRCAGSIVIDIIPTNGADKRKFFPFAPYFPVTNVIKRYFYPYFPAIIGIKGYSFPYFPYLSGIMKIKTALYSLFSRLDWHKTVVFPCLGEIYEGIRSLSWEIPVT